MVIRFIFIKLYTIFQGVPLIKKMKALIWMIFERKRKRADGSDHQALAAEHRVDAVCRLELFVGADFDNFSAVEYADPVGVADS